MSALLKERAALIKQECYAKGVLPALNVANFGDEIEHASDSDFCSLLGALIDIELEHEAHKRAEILKLSGMSANDVYHPSLREQAAQAIGARDCEKGKPPTLKCESYQYGYGRQYEKEQVATAQSGG
jgi:hypothetical protein